MGILAEKYVELGFAAIAISVFLYLYICKTREDSKQSAQTNEAITKINTKIFDMFVQEIKVIAENTHDNRKLNKDISVIQAQMQKQLIDHGTHTNKMWDKQIDAMDKLCDSLNGSNPKILALQKEINDLKGIMARECG